MGTGMDTAITLEVPTPESLGLVHDGGITWECTLPRSADVILLVLNPGKVWLCVTYEHMRCGDGLDAIDTDYPSLEMALVALSLILH